MRDILMFVVANVLMMVALHAQAASTDRWAMYQGDVGHTGYIAQSVLPNLVALAGASTFNRDHREPRRRERLE